MLLVTAVMLVAGGAMMAALVALEQHQLQRESRERVSYAAPHRIQPEGPTRFLSR